MGKKQSIASGLEDLFKKDSFIEQQKATALIANRVSKNKKNHETSLKAVSNLAQQEGHTQDHLGHSQDHLGHSQDHLGHSQDHLGHTQDHLDHSQDHLGHSQDHVQSHSINHTEDHSTTLSITQKLDHSKDQSLSQSLNFFSQNWGIDHLTKKQQIVFKTIVECEHEILKYEDISIATGIPKNSVRTIIRRLITLKILTTERARKGIRQGLKMEIEISPKSNSHTQKNNANQSLNQSLSQSTFDSNTQQTTQSDLYLHKKERKNYSFFLNLHESDIEAQFPLLKKLGFGVKQVHEIIECLKKFDKSAEHFLQGLQHAEAALEYGLLNNMAKGEVKDPLGYIFASLRKHGTFDRPPGWISPEERAVEDTARRIDAEKKRLAMLEELESISEKAEFLKRFHSWKSGLSLDELEEIRRRLPGGGPKSLEIYFRTKVEGVG